MLSGRAPRRNFCCHLNHSRSESREFGSFTSSSHRCIANAIQVHLCTRHTALQGINLSQLPLSTQRFVKTTLLISEISRRKRDAINKLHFFSTQIARSVLSAQTQPKTVCERARSHDVEVHNTPIGSSAKTIKKKKKFHEKEILHF